MQYFDYFSLVIEPNRDIIVGGGGHAAAAGLAIRREHLNEFKIGESKAPSTPGPTKESKGTPVILNRRLLI